MVAETQAVQQRGGASAGAVAIDVGVVGMQMGDGLAVVAVFGIAQGGLDAAQLRIAVQRVVDGDCIERRRILRHVGDDPLRRQFEIALLLMQVVGQQCEQTGFAAAIGTGETDFLTGMQTEIDAFEQGAARPGEGEIAYENHGIFKVPVQPARGETRYCTQEPNRSPTMKQFFVSLFVAVLPLIAFSAHAADEPGASSPTSAPGALSVANPPATLITPEEAQQLTDKARALKERADKQKAEAAAKLEESETSCWQRFLVSSCQDQAKEDHTKAMVEARKLDTESRQIERDIRRREQARKEAEEAAEAPQRAADEAAKAVRGREESAQYAKRRAEEAAARDKRATQGQVNAVTETKRRAEFAAEREQKRKKAEEKARERAEKDKRRAEVREAERRANGIIK